MVRLKEDVLQCLLPQMLFQFHYGTIKSTYIPRMYVNNVNNFNSTMVRLKD